MEDNITGISNPEISVKRIPATVYDDTRMALKNRLETMLKEICAIVEYRGAKTVRVTDVIFVLNRMGTPLYGFGLAER
ncbi:hypothetical protein H2203_000779 [Taxawa tesnikishii (nom. ined.)]|nr:hypothetical protein H2203_000779 [Dothideales sp. JES 119]